MSLRASTRMTSNGSQHKVESSVDPKTTTAEDGESPEASVSKSEMEEPGSTAREDGRLRQRQINTVGKSRYLSQLQNASS